MLQAKAAFEQVKLIRVGVLLIVIDLIGSGVIFSVLPPHTAQWVHLSVLALMIGLAVWMCIRDRNIYIQYRQGFIEDLEPGWFMVGNDGCMKRAKLEAGTDPSGEQEMVALGDQGGRDEKLACVANAVFYVMMFGLFFSMEPTGPAGFFELRLGIWALFLAILVRWAVWGNAFFAGVNRLAIDPVGWSWCGWSRRLAKGGRWENTRVLVKPMTKHGRDRYFVVMGDGDQSIGMIVPKGSVDLLWRAYANSEVTPTASSPDDSDPCPAN